MTALTALALAGAANSAIKGGIKGYGEYGAAQDLKLSAEQRKRLRELERRMAEDSLGMNTGERELYRSQAMSPVQTAEREALARFGASQSVADIGQGSAFRQQQSLKQASENARAEVSKSVASRDAQVADLQTAEKARLEMQQNQSQALERQAAMSVLGGVAEGATGYVSVKAEHKYQEELYNKRLKDLKAGQVATSTGAQTFLGLDKIKQPGESATLQETDQYWMDNNEDGMTDDDWLYKNIPGNTDKSPGMKALENLSATNDSLGGDSNRFINGMTRNVSEPEEQVINITENLPTVSPTQDYPLHYNMFNSTSNEHLVPMLESVTETGDGEYGTIQSPADAVKRLQTLDPEKQKDFVLYLNEQRNQGLLKDNFWNIFTARLIEQGY